MDLAIKAKLYEQCMEYAHRRVQEAQDELSSLRDSAGSETKSSAGDKHETGRAMVQLEQEKATRQLHEAQLLVEALHRIDSAGVSPVVMSGSLVFTDQGDFYISIPAGRIEAEGRSYYALSPAAPLAKALSGRKAGSAVDFGGREYRITRVI
jgi:transcription elongation GreA/GreB family factor